MEALGCFKRLPDGEIASWVERFVAQTAPTERYSSFDYCYNYFRTVENVEADVEKSCLVLGFYLASWGMMRGSSFLLQKSAKHLEPVIRYLAALDRAIWNIDVDSYTSRNIDLILSAYQDVKKLLIPTGKQDVVLTTKVLLGVFGFVPAFDNYFTATFRELSSGRCGSRKVNGKSLALVGEFYRLHQDEIDSLSEGIFTFDFNTGNKTNIRYPKAKIIDMYGFAAGLATGRLMA